MGQTPRRAAQRPTRDALKRAGGLAGVKGATERRHSAYERLGGRRFYQFTAVDEATRYRVLRISTHNSIPNAIAFIDEIRQRLPMAIQRVQTDHGNAFGTDFTWHLRDLAIAHRHIPPGCPEVNDSEDWARLFPGKGQGQASCSTTTVVASHRRRNVQATSAQAISA